MVETSAPPSPQVQATPMVVREVFNKLRRTVSRPQGSPKPSKQDSPSGPKSRSANTSPSRSMRLMGSRLLPLAPEPRKPLPSAEETKASADGPVKEKLEGSSSLSDLASVSQVHPANYMEPGPDAPEAAGNPGTDDLDPEPSFASMPSSLWV